MSSNIIRFWLPILALALTACGGSSGNRFSAPTAAGAVKFLPVSAHAPALSVLVDGGEDDTGQQLADLAFGQLSVFGLLPGDTRFTVRYSLPDGVGPDRQYESALAPFNLNIVENVRYDIFVGGDYQSAEHWVAETPRTFDERETHARLVLTNASPALPAVDIHLTAVDANIDSASLLTSLAYKETDNTVRVEPGDYQLKVTAANSATVVYTSDVLTVSAGTDMSLTTMDNAWVKQGVTGKPPIVVSRSGVSGSATLMFSADSGADLRVVHASPDAGLLDVVMDDADPPFVEDIALGDVTPYATLESGVFNFKVLPADTASPAQVDRNFNLMNGVAWTLFLMGEWDDLESVFVSQNAREIAALSRLQVVHGSTAAGDVNVFITDVGANLLEESPVGSDMTLKQASNFLSIEPGSYDITFVDAGTLIGDIIYQLEAVPLAANEVYTLLLRDEPNATAVTHTWLDSAP